MRRFTLTLGCLAGISLAACQDGPTQTYQPPPPAAGWNNGRSPFLPDGGLNQVPNGTATTSSAPFATPDGGAIGSGGNNANEICTPAQVYAMTAAIANAPIQLPNGAAGLNLAGTNGDGGVTWQGLTIEQAEQQICQGTSIPDIFGTVSDISVYWDNQSIIVEYSLTTHKIDYIGLFAPSYTGTMNITSLDGNTSYTIAVDGQTAISVATKDSQGNVTTAPIAALDWVGASNGLPVSVKPFDDMYRAAMATFMPGFPVEPKGFTCNQTGACIIGTFPAGAYAYFFIPALGWAMWVNPYYNAAAAIAPNRMDINFAQIMNFSPANPVLKMDAKGPTTVPLQIGQSGTPPCELTLGMSYLDFEQNCLLTAPGGQNAAANQSELRELFSDFSHGEQTFSFNIAGVDLSFADARLGKTQTVVDPPVAGGCPGNPTDPACPQAQDLSYELNVDQSTLGNVANDWIYDSNGNPLRHDLHGWGAIVDDFRGLSMQYLEQEVCAPGAPQTPISQADCAAWFPTADGGSPPALTAQIAGCIEPRDSSGALLDSTFPADFPGAPGAPVGSTCTGMEDLVSSDITTPDDPVNVGPIASLIAPAYSLGMKMGHQQGAWCTDAMSRNQIAKQSYMYVCPGQAQSCALPGQSSFSCAPGSCDPTVANANCAAGTPTCTTQTATVTPFSVAQIDYIGEVGQSGFLLNMNPDPTGTPTPAPAGAQIVLVLPQYCSANNILPQAELQVVNAIGGGNDSNLPIDVQGGKPSPGSPRFFFKMYGMAMIQTLEATDKNGQLIAPVSSWGPPTLGSAMPISLADLYFDSSGDGQFETMEYVDRRFVCPDGADNCAPVGATGWTCPSTSCDLSVAANANCVSSPLPTCNPNETWQAPLDLNFNADVKDGIMNAYDLNRLSRRGEAALYEIIQPAGFAPQKASNALLSDMFGSPVLSANAAGWGADPTTGQLFPALPNGSPAGPPFVDLTGNPIYAQDYPDALGINAPTALSLSFGQAPDQNLTVVQSFQGSQQALVQYPYPNGPTSTSGSPELLEQLIPWVPSQPGSGFNEAEPNNSELDYFVQTQSLDFTGTTTTGLLDFNLLPMGGPGSPLGMERLAVESQNYLGDVFMCYEPAANPPLLAIRMYTPTAAVLDWLNRNPQAYTDCGIVVRWSPYDNYVNLVESTTNGVRLQVTQGGGLGRVVGATLYVPGLPFEE